MNIRCKVCMAGAMVLGLGGLGAWAMLREPPAPVVVPEPQAKAVEHASAQQVLAGSLERLHTEALAHFHADPKNGFYRMAPVYQKVVKEWKTPWFSVGELDHAQPIPFQKDMERIHQGAVKDFLTPRSADQEQPAPTFAIVFDEKKYDRTKKVWEAKNIDLIGLVKHPEPVVYVSEKITPNMTRQDTPPTRMLDEFELGGLAMLHKGENLFARSSDGVIRLLGAVRTEAECVSCHREKKEGDLLGAFSYTLREAEYKRVPFGASRPPGPVQKEAK